jgi:hypothetical protein
VLTGMRGPALLCLVLAAGCGRREASRPGAVDAAPVVADAAVVRTTRADDTAEQEQATTAEPGPLRPPEPPSVLAGDGHRTIECLHVGLPGEVPALPDGVLLQSLVVAADGRQAGLRVYEDGRVEAKAIDREWEPGKALAAERLAIVRGAVEGGGLARAAGAHRVRSPTGALGANWLQARRDGEVVSAVFDDPCFVPEIDAVLVRLVEVFD